MQTSKTTDFGKNVKKRLIDLGKTQVWLINEVSKSTKLYFDGSYLHKILTGQLSTPKVMEAICEILDLSSIEQEDDA